MAQAALIVSLYAKPRCVGRPQPRHPKRYPKPCEITLAKELVFSQASKRNQHRTHALQPSTMNGRGLQSSIWASGEGYDSFKRVGDWSCPSCGFSNFAWRKECFRCSPAWHLNGLHTNGHLPAPADHLNRLSTSPHDTHHVQAAKAADFGAVHPPAQKEHGLSTSRWAPRNYRGRTKSDNIWTRVSFRDPAEDSVANPGRRCPPIHRLFPTLTELFRPLLTLAFHTRFSTIFFR